MKRAFTLLEMLIAVAVLALLAALLFPMFTRSNTGGRRPVCQSNLKQIGLGFLQYAQDYDEKLPSTAAPWADVLQPYLKDWRVFQCPDTETSNGRTAYFYNGRLASVSQSTIGNAASLLMAGDGLPDQAPNTALWQLPAAWVTDAGSPAHRHLDAANYLFADGHIKSLAPTLIAPSVGTPNQPTFRTKIVAPTAAQGKP